MEQNIEPIETKDEQQVDTYWIVANIFAIIHILEDKFGMETIERLVAAATAIEAGMRQESEEAK